MLCVDVLLQANILFILFGEPLPPVTNERAKKMMRDKFFEFDYETKLL